MAYKFDFVGDENYKLAFVTLPDDRREFGTFPESRQFLPESEQLSQVGSYCFHEAPRGHATVANGVESEPVGLFYTRRNKQLRPTQVFFQVGDVKREWSQLRQHEDIFVVCRTCSNQSPYPQPHPPPLFLREHVAEDVLLFDHGLFSSLLHYVCHSFLSTSDFISPFFSSRCIMIESAYYADASYAFSCIERPPPQVLYHKFGDDVAEDVVLFEAINPMFTVSVRQSADREWILIDYASSTENEVRVIPVVDTLKRVARRLAQEGDPSAAKYLHPMKYYWHQTVVRPLVPSIKYRAEHANGAWFLNTKEGCRKEHYRVLRKHDSENDFSVFVDEHMEFAMDDWVFTKSYLGVSYLGVRTGQPRESPSCRTES